MNRRRFLAGSVGVSAAALGAPWVTVAAAATEDELAFANFGVSAEFLLKDYYAKALARKQFGRARARVLRQGQANATRHASALGELLTAAADTPPLEQDFEFAWPKKAFANRAATVKTGLVVLRALLGAYQSASAMVAAPADRALYASLCASVGQQFAALSALTDQVGTAPFPAALDLEAASATLEPYLG